MASFIQKANNYMLNILYWAIYSWIIQNENLEDLVVNSKGWGREERAGGKRKGRKGNSVIKEIAA